MNPHTLQEMKFQNPSFKQPIQSCISYFLYFLQNTAWLVAIVNMAKE